MGRSETAIASPEIAAPLAVDGRDQPRRGLGLPNQISLFRLLLVPGIVASLLYYHPNRDGLRLVTLGLFLLGVISDAVDGFLARLFNQRTELGTLLDPVADKALILGTLISCSMIHGLPSWMRIPAWFNLIVISRDVLLVTGAFVLYTIHGRWQVRPSPLGKLTTVSQMLVIPTVLLGWPGKLPLLVLAAWLTTASGIQYVRAGLRLLS